MAKFIFICGTGRSGTHLIGRSVGSHRDIEARIESPESFGLITSIASLQDFKRGWRMVYWRLKLNRVLKKVLFSSNKKYVLEKSHPSLWLYEDLNKKFPGSKFIGVWRDSEPTISSMLRHKGVLAWFKKLPDNNANRFLGVREDHLLNYRNFSIIEKCYLRWLSHINEVKKLEKENSNFLAINYDEFILQNEKELARIAKFLNIENDFTLEDLNITSLNKWEEYLSDSDKQVISDCRKRFN